jgi:hypothetical protein
MASGRRIAPQLTDAELVTPAMLQATLGFVSEALWFCHARGHVRYLFPYVHPTAWLRQAPMPGRRAAAGGHPAAGRRHPGGGNTPQEVGAAGCASPFGQVSGYGADRSQVR